ncbi:MAG: hypothetical protein H7A05_00435 [Pseudomonadales bacterium]|nr:hypothetical protein [Pseudomonadales bacterium]MCP5330031.1 hypothetical protein [Pseudomonadales bacterium]MCP5343060.1 hypothetical protein [Pseudomonadales bacterium]
MNTAIAPRIVLFLSLILGASFANADVSGNWVFAVDIMGQTGNAQVSMTQKGEAISGHYSGQLGNTDFTGSAKGNDFQFVLKGEAGSVTYTGTLQSDGTIKGSVDLAGMAQGSYTAKKGA